MCAPFVAGYRLAHDPARQQFFAMLLHNKRQHHGAVTGAATVRAACKFGPTGAAPFYQVSACPYHGACLK
jgi:hypothetical protein